MQLNSSSSSFKDIEEGESELFQSLIEDSDNLSRNQCTIQAKEDLQNSHAFASSQYEKQFERSKLSGEEQSDSSLVEQPQPESPILIRRQYSKQYHNRLEHILQRNRPHRQIEKQKFSLDTSSVLIKLINFKRHYRMAFNVYISLSIILRILYVTLTIYQTVVYSMRKNYYFFWTLGGFGFTRILFMFSNYKLLKIGERTKDKKIKAVYETYLKWFDDVEYKVRQLERESNSIICRTIEDEESLTKLTLEINRLQKQLICLKTYIIFIPPELSFLYFRKLSNGFFQVQNFIIKSLELYFFMPPFLFFLKEFQGKKDTFIILDFTDHEVQNIFNIMVVFDVGVFLVIAIYLLFIGNKRYKIKPQ